MAIDKAADSKFGQIKCLFDWARSEDVLKEEPKLELLHSTLTTASVKSRAYPGVMIGWPNVCLPVISNGYCGMWIYLQYQSSYFSDIEKKTVEMLKRQGYHVVRCSTYKKAIVELCRYLGHDV